MREREEKDRELAWQERLVVRYAEVLGEQREDTKANVERKQALTDRERTVSLWRRGVQFDTVSGAVVPVGICTCHFFVLMCALLIQFPFLPILCSLPHSSSTSKKQ